jgi:hypothetical protein
MLQGRLNRVIIATAALAVAAGCSEGGPIEENVVRPGITAIEQASALGCGNDAATLRTALDAYELLEGTPAPDEQALIDGEYLRDESDLWDIVDGRLVAVDPDCGSAETDLPQAVEIVTSTEPPQTVDQVLAGFTADDVAALGGDECARQLAAVLAGIDQFITQEGRQPDNLDELADAGYFVEPITLWHVVDDVLVPVSDSGCTDLAAGDD